MKQQALPNLNAQQLEDNLFELKLPAIKDNYEALAQLAVNEGWAHIQYLEALIREEKLQRQQRGRQRKIKQARFPVIKTLEQYNWSWPESINEMQIKNLFRMQFVKNKHNAIFLGGVGLGKTHLATALGYQACLHDYSVLFTTAVEAINNLSAAQKAGTLKQELAKYLKPQLLILDELGYLPIDKRGADLLFQVISGRYEKGALVITTNRAYKDWAEIFNNDSTLTSAILDRLLHHVETVVIEGNSYRMREQVKQH